MKKIDVHNLVLETKTTDELLELRLRLSQRLRLLKTTRPYRFYVVLWLALVFGAIVFFLCFLNPPPPDKLWLPVTLDILFLILGFIIGFMFLHSFSRFKKEVEDVEELLSAVEIKLSLGAS